MAGLRLRREWPHLIEASLLACQGNVLACSGPASVRFWDLESGEPLSEPLECFPYAAEELMFVAGQKLLALGGGLWEWSLGSAESKILKAIDPAEPHLRYWSHPSEISGNRAFPNPRSMHLKMECSRGSTSKCTTRPLTFSSSNTCMKIQLKSIIYQHF